MENHVTGRRRARQMCRVGEALGPSTGAKTLGLGHLPLDAQAPEARKLGAQEFVAYALVYCLPQITYHRGYNMILMVDCWNQLDRTRRFLFENYILSFLVYHLEFHAPEVNCRLTASLDSSASREIAVAAASLPRR